MHWLVEKEDVTEFWALNDDTVFNEYTLNASFLLITACLADAVLRELILSQWLLLQF